jgi:uncharacterized protein DUF4892
MMIRYRTLLLYCAALVSSMFFSAVVTAQSPGVVALLQEVDAYPHTQQVEFSQREVIDYEVGLGAIQKIRGEWHFKDSERVSGTLLSYTWLMDPGFSAAELMAQLLDSVADINGASELFACEGRACGRAVQWANRVFKQRVLFGREDLQRYRVYSFEGTPRARLLTYSAERTADRQYLHVEWLVMSP